MNTWSLVKLTSVYFGFFLREALKKNTIQIYIHLYQRIVAQSSNETDLYQNMVLEIEKKQQTFKKKKSFVPSIQQGATHTHTETPSVIVLHLKTLVDRASVNTSQSDSTK